MDELNNKNDKLISMMAAVDAVETIGFDFSDSGLSAAEIEEVCEAIGEVRQEWSRRIKRLPSAQPDGWLEQNKDKILQAGMEGREIDFRIGGRLFAIREKAQ